MYEYKYSYGKITHSNKASVSQQQKLAEIDVVDGGSFFAPKFITKKPDCGTLIKKLW